MKICWKCTLRDVDEFVSPSELDWRNVALHHLLTYGSSAVNGCRQNDKTSQSTSNPHHSSTSNNILRREKLHVLRHKSTIKTSWLNPSLLAKIRVHIIMDREAMVWSYKRPNYWFVSLKHSFLFHKTLIDGLEWCGLLWCFYQLFGLSFWWHPFTAEDPLVSKWCNATFLQICSDEETNSSISWMTWGWVHF